VTSYVLGWTVLGGFLHVTGYPDSFVTSADPSSLGMFHGVPRVLMGMLAVLDTFLVYKIAERRFGRRAAVIASLLFAVMPASLMLRLVLLDSILLPFVLASVLLAMHARGAAGTAAPVRDRTWLPVVLSGICMGCAILVKIPSVAMIPLALALVYSANRSPRQALLWLAPVILIAAVWPASAMLAGELDLWTDGVLWQTDRNSQHSLNALQKYLPVIPVQGQDPDVLTHPLILLVAIRNLFLNDPVLMALGVAGLAFAAVTRNRFLILWAASVLLFFGSIGWVVHVHLGMLWTAMCIAAAALIATGMARMPAGGGRPAGNLALLAAVAAIAAFGMSTSGVLVHWDVTSPYLDGLSFALQSYAGSDTAVVMRMIPESFLPWTYDLVHAGTDTSDEPGIPAKAKKTAMVTSSREIDWHRSVLEARYVRGPDGVTVRPGDDWRQRQVDLYDGSDRVAEFQGRPRPDTPAPSYLLSGHDTHRVVEVMERLPSEWALLPTYAPAGQALRLDGSAPVTLAGTPDLEATDPFSVAFWIKMTDAAGPGPAIITRHSPPPQAEFAISGNAYGGISFTMRGDEAGHIEARSFHSVADGYWHHVVLTYDGSGGLGGLNLYVDGSNDNLRWNLKHVPHASPQLVHTGGSNYNVGQTGTTPAGSAADGHPITIGAGSAGARIAQDTLLDDVMIYSEELPAEHVSRIHECHRERAVILSSAEGMQSGGAPAGGHPCAGGDRNDALMAHLEFEGDLSDSSGRGNGGTAHGDVRHAYSG